MQKLYYFLWMLNFDCSLWAQSIQNKFWQINFNVVKVHNILPRQATKIRHYWATFKSTLFCHYFCVLKQFKISWCLNFNYIRYRLFLLKLNQLQILFPLFFLCYQSLVKWIFSQSFWKFFTITFFICIKYFAIYFLKFWNSFWILFTLFK